MSAMRIGTAATSTFCNGSYAPRWAIQNKGAHRNSSLTRGVEAAAWCDRQDPPNENLTVFRQRR